MKRSRDEGAASKTAESVTPGAFSIPAKPKKAKQGKPKARGNGEGSIFQRLDGRWVAELFVGYKADGKEDKRYAYRKTRKEAGLALTELLAQRDKGMLPNADGMTVAQFLDVWLKNTSRDLKANTKRSYESMVKKHLEGRVGKVKLHKLQPMHLEQMVNEMLSDGHSPSLTGYALRLTKMALNWAVRKQILPRNVADAVDAPKVVREELTVWTGEEAKKFLSYVKDHRLYAAYYLALLTGMRRGEVLGLKWGDIDFERSRLTVRHNLIDDPAKRLVLETPKTKASRRVIALSADVIAVFHEHKERTKLERGKREKQHARGEVQGEAWASPEMVFVSEYGTFIDPSNFTTTFKRLEREAGVPIIRFHDLRHTSASLLVRRGVGMKLIADKLGHTDPGFTMRTYVHAYDDQREEAALGFDELFGTQEKTTEKP